MVKTDASSSVHALEDTLFFVLLQIIIIILIARAAGELARRFGQPRAVGEIIAGLVLGPSLFGYLFPGVFTYLFHSVSAIPISIIGQIGLILLMFQIGMDFDFSHLREKKNRRAVLFISIACIGLPFVLGFAIGQISAPYLALSIDPMAYSLFVGIALSITAVPILGRIMAEYDLTRTRVGAIAISAAAVNDVVGWVLLALIAALTTAKFTLSATVTQIALLGLYVAVCVLVVRPALRWVIAWFSPTPGPLPGNLVGLMLALIFVSGMATYKIGIFAIFGGFMLGVLVHDLHGFVAEWKRTVGNFALVFFLPIFFTYTGLRTDITGLDTLTLWNWCLVIFVAAVLGKFGGAYIGARLAGLDRHSSSTVGVLMNTRALMELIVLNIGYDAGFIPQNVFTMLVIMALATTIMTGPALRSMLPKMGHIVPLRVDA